jgi:hypothetical protein
LENPLFWNQKPQFQSNCSCLTEAVGHTTEIWW